MKASASGCRPWDSVDSCDARIYKGSVCASNATSQAQINFCLDNCPFSETECKNCFRDAGGELPANFKPMVRENALSDELLERFRSLYYSGAPVESVAISIGVSRGHAYKLVKKYCDPSLRKSEVMA